jgi:hypothetical protein
MPVGWRSFVTTNQPGKRMYTHDDKTLNASLFFHHPSAPSTNPPAHPTLFFISSFFTFKNRLPLVVQYDAHQLLHVKELS